MAFKIVSGSMKEISIFEKSSIILRAFSAGRLGFRRLEINFFSRFHSTKAPLSVKQLPSLGAFGYKALDEAFYKYLP